MIVKTQSSRPYGGPCLSKFYVGSSTREELVFDFNLPETKQRYESEVAKRLDVALDIEDIRGREADFTLFRNGFQYVRHELPPGLQSEAAANYTEEEVAAVLVAPTENLVKEMRVPNQSPGKLEVLTSLWLVEKWLGRVELTLAQTQDRCFQDHDGRLPTPLYGHRPRQKKPA